MLRTLFAAAEPSATLRPGERVIGCVVWSEWETEWILSREPVRAKGKRDAHGRLRKRGRR